MTSSQAQGQTAVPHPSENDTGLMQHAVKRRRRAKKAYMSIRTTLRPGSPNRRTSASAILSLAQAEFDSTADAQRALLDTAVEVITIAVSCCV